ncbi:MAG: phage holin family protein [Candidatus Roizmanbacteria bacterium]|nr:MAG: phage holin family protein [Candidatus Roizmanbacteria bacterium]
MKRLLRMFIFSAFALYITSLWNEGFIIKFEIYSLLVLILAIVLLYYIVKPLTKIILFPLNILTFGLVSLAVYCFLFYIIASQSSVIIINSWIFHGGSYLGVNLAKMNISYVQNIVLSSLSVSFIISLLEKIL